MTEKELKRLSREELLQLMLLQAEENKRLKKELEQLRQETPVGRNGTPEDVAKAMAKGAKVISGANFAISTTGIAGPTGGSEAKPVGTVWIGIATPDRCFAVRKNCGTDRSQIISRATAYAIAMLYEELK